MNPDPGLSSALDVSGEGHQRLVSSLQPVRLLRLP